MGLTLLPQEEPIEYIEKYISEGSTSIPENLSVAVHFQVQGDTII